jgi:hypothetical protein
MCRPQRDRRRKSVLGFNQSYKYRFDGWRLVIQPPSPFFRATKPRQQHWTNLISSIFSVGH